MIYDAKDYGEALEPPVLRIGDREWTGRLLSIDEVAPFQQRLSKVGADEKVEWDEIRELIREITDLIFPIIPTIAFWKWRPPASWHLVRLPPGQMIALFNAFLGPQTRAMGIQAPGLGTETTGAPV